MMGLVINRRIQILLFYDVARPAVFGRPDIVNQRFGKRSARGTYVVEIALPFVSRWYDFAHRSKT